MISLHGAAAQPAVEDELHRAFVRVLDGAAALALASGALEVEVPGDLARLEGSGPSGALIMSTRRFSGGAFRALTTAAVSDAEGRLRTATVVGLPARGRLSPILGVDLIALRGGLSLLALDLAPTDATFWEAHAAPLLRETGRALEGVLVPRTVPRFAEETFSGRALIGAARKDHEVAALEAALRLVEAARTCLGGDHPSEADRAAAAEARLVRWCAAELENRREHDALARMFGATKAREYLEEFLFAEGRRGRTEETR